MKIKKRKKLQSQGWKVGSADELLGLSKEETQFVQLKLLLSRYLKSKRIDKKFSQVDFAKQIKSSQSRVAKMESGDPTVSVDLLLHSLFALGTTKKELANVILAN